MKIIPIVIRGCCDKPGLLSQILLETFLIINITLPFEKGAGWEMST